MSDSNRIYFLQNESMSLKFNMLLNQQYVYIVFI